MYIQWGFTQPKKEKNKFCNNMDGPGGGYA